MPTELLFRLVHGFKQAWVYRVTVLNFHDILGRIRLPTCLQLQPKWACFADSSENGLFKSLPLHRWFILESYICINLQLHAHLQKLPNKFLRLLIVLIFLLLLGVGPIVQQVRSILRRIVPIKAFLMFTYIRLRYLILTRLVWVLVSLIFNLLNWVLF